MVSSKERINWPAITHLVLYLSFCLLLEFSHFAQPLVRKRRENLPFDFGAD